jgi:signal transduction histidine kinase
MNWINGIDGFIAFTINPQFLAVPFILFFGHKIKCAHIKYLLFATSNYLIYLYALPYADDIYALGLDLYGQYIFSHCLAAFLIWYLQSKWSIKNKVRLMSINELDELQKEIEAHKEGLSIYRHDMANVLNVAQGWISLVLYSNRVEDPEVVKMLERSYASLRIACAPKQRMYMLVNDLKNIEEYQDIKVEFKESGEFDGFFSQHDIYRVLTSMITNAKTAMATVCHITVFDDCIKVDDNGHPLSKEYREAFKSDAKYTSKECEGRFGTISMKKLLDQNDLKLYLGDDCKFIIRRNGE